jgi:NAD(P)H dehydrogenase (quinone)
MTTFLVTGAGGHLGRLAAETLLDSKAGKVIAATRDPAKLNALATRGAEVRRADFDDPNSLSSAFAGVDRLLLVSTDALDRPGRRLAQHRNAIAAAIKAGVKHIVYTSAPNARPLGRSGILDDHYWTEQALAASGLDWTVLRNHIYAEISLMGLPHAIATSKLFTATGSGGRSYVTRDDCARAAAGALVKATGRSIFDVTGPKPVTQTELAKLVSTLTGKQIEHVPVSGADLAKGLAGAGLPPLLVEALVDFDVDAAQGFHAIVTPVVKDFSGRDPTPLADFLTANRAALKPAA